MKTYKFATTVHEHGILRIPELESYADQKVEVTVVVKPKVGAKQKKQTLEDFLSKWAGFFSGTPLVALLINMRRASAACPGLDMV